jgi:hypothetical protein
LLLPAGLPQAQALSADRTSNIRTIALQAAELDGMIRRFKLVGETQGGGRLAGQSQMAALGMRAAHT